MDALQLFIGIVSVVGTCGGAVIALMFTRALNRIDGTLDEHGEDISRLKVDVSKAQGSSDAIAELVRQLRHDVRDFKQSTTGQLQEIMKILMRGDK